MKAFFTSANAHAPGITKRDRDAFTTEQGCAGAITREIAKRAKAS
jgi:hypothetical protein